MQTNKNNYGRCLDARLNGLIIEYVEGELSEDERSRVSEHLKTCADCSREESNCRSAFNMLRNAPPIESPGDLYAGFAAKLYREEKRSRQRIRLLHWSAIGACLAMFMLGVHTTLQNEDSGKNTEIMQRPGLLRPFPPLRTADNPENKAGRTVDNYKNMASSRDSESAKLPLKNHRQIFKSERINNSIVAYKSTTHARRILVAEAASEDIKRELWESGIPSVFSKSGSSRIKPDLNRALSVNLDTYHHAAAPALGYVASNKDTTNLGFRASVSGESKAFGELDGSAGDTSTISGPAPLPGEAMDAKMFGRSNSRMMYKGDTLTSEPNGGGVQVKDLAMSDVPAISISSLEAEDIVEQPGKPVRMVKAVDDHIRIGDNITRINSAVGLDTNGRIALVRVNTETTTLGK